ncbi:hypothetical protein [Paracoccus seriniphilus]|uniref:hypothetical protein n=1 Tax=Paracoccus seriniphilus TaxID=184748 RepID=UPI002350CE84|nr:hypothetical protein [Paracoccus seriniphilus]WCR12942.1 hypothetical protein JHW44_08225 [Paracoccus seriniphilus]
MRSEARQAGADDPALVWVRGDAALQILSAMTFPCGADIIPSVVRDATLMEIIALKVHRRVVPSFCALLPFIAS